MFVLESRFKEAHFAHRALWARAMYEWIGFMDLAELFHLPTGMSISDILRNQSKSANSKVSWL